MQFSFDGGLLAKAVTATFSRRGTEVPRQAPVALTNVFAEDLGKMAQWTAFIKKLRAADTRALAAVIREVAGFALPLFGAVVAGSSPGRWSAGGPWVTPG